MCTRSGFFASCVLAPSVRRCTPAHTTHALAGATGWHRRRVGAARFLHCSQCYTGVPLCERSTACSQNITTSLLSIIKVKSDPAHHLLCRSSHATLCALNVGNAILLSSVQKLTAYSPVLDCKQRRSAHGAAAWPSSSGRGARRRAAKRRCRVCRARPQLMPLGRQSCCCPPRSEQLLWQTCTACSRLPRHHSSSPCSPCGGMGCRLTCEDQ